MVVGLGDRSTADVKADLRAEIEAELVGGGWVQLAENGGG